MSLAQSESSLIMRRKAQPSPTSGSEDLDDPVTLAGSSYQRMEEVGRIGSRRMGSR